MRPGSSRWVFDRAVSETLTTWVAPWIIVLLLMAPAQTFGQTASVPDWTAVERETLEHFRALVRLDTSNPPGNETRAVDYLRQVLEAEGIPVETFALEADRANLVARLRGSGSKRPLLLMAHTDVVTVDESKWTHPPFAADVDGGYIYGRGTLDDKDNLATSLMVMLLLNRLDVALDRDVVFLAESGEEGTTHVGIELMVNEHLDRIDAEFCLAEGGSVRREGGEVRYASVQTVEKIPRAVSLTATGVAGHGSVPLQSNPVVRLSAAIGKVAEWEAPIRLNETTGSYFRRLSQISPPEAAARYAAVLDPAQVRQIDRYFRASEPEHAALLHTTASPNIVDGGYRINVIPSEATATIDVRLLPDDDPMAILQDIRAVVDDPAVAVDFIPRNARPAGTSSLGTEAFEAIETAVTKHYGVPTLPAMSTGATDMSYLRARGIQCYGLGPARDIEDGPKGFGAHGDQERILESELHRFVRFNWDVVLALAATN